jgi:hypothetical protein
VFTAVWPSQGSYTLRHIITIYVIIEKEEKGPSSEKTTYGSICD